MRTPLTKRRAPGAVVLLVGALAAVPAPVAAQDPFQPGLRWTGAVDPLQPAIPQAVTFAAGGNLVWGASRGGVTRRELYSAFETGVPGARGAAVVPGATGALAVAAPEQGDALFGLVQVPAPDSTHRATLVTRSSALGASGSGTVTDEWTFDSGLRANGPARLACSGDGARVFVANWNGPTPEVRLDVLDGATGLSLAHALLPAASLSGLSASADGLRIGVSAGLDLWILDPAASVVHQQALLQATTAVSLSGDGSRVAFGGTRVHVLAARGTGYAPAFEVSGNPGEIASRVALSRDASTLAIGWWNAVTAVDARFEVVDVATRGRLFERVLPGGSSGLQNAVEVVRVTPDGRRAACGAWGDGTSAADVIVYDRDLHATVLEADLPGSVFALDLDGDGRRVVIGAKSAHANSFATGGEWRLLDTGEDDTAIVHAPRLGASLHVASRRAGASAVAFLSGPRLPAPVTLPGIGGSLALDRSRLLLVRGPAGPDGRADLLVPIPADPLLLGTWRHLQSAFLVNGAWQLGESVRDVLVH